VSVAAVLACCYAAGLVVVAVLLGVDWTTRRGIVGHLASTMANRGVAYFIVACLGGAALLAFGAVAAWRGRRGFAAIIPLAIVAGVGAIGEPIDIASGNSFTSNLIGGLIIGAVVIPIVLFLLPRKRRLQ
jgi:hypothetical protein